MFRFIHESPFVFIESMDRDIGWVCGISPDDSNNKYNGLYIYRKESANIKVIVGVDAV